MKLSVLPTVLLPLLHSTSVSAAIAISNHVTEHIPPQNRSTSTMERQTFQLTDLHYPNVTAQCDHLYDPTEVPGSSEITPWIPCDPQTFSFSLAKSPPSQYGSWLYINVNHTREVYNISDSGISTTPITIYSWSVYQWLNYAASHNRTNSNGTSTYTNGTAGPFNVRNEGAYANSSTELITLRDGGHFLAPEVWVGDPALTSLDGFRKMLSGIGGEINATNPVGVNSPYAPVNLSVWTGAWLESPTWNASLFPADVWASAPSTIELADADQF